jgi:hypothetical protein
MIEVCKRRRSKISVEVVVVVVGRLGLSKSLGGEEFCRPAVKLPLVFGDSKVVEYFVHKG